MYHITSFQCLTQELTQSTECLPEFGPGTESVLQPDPSQQTWTEWRCGLLQNSEEKADEVLRTEALGIFFAHLWDWKSLSSAPRQRVSRKWGEQQFPMQPPAWESRWSGEEKPPFNCALMNKLFVLPCPLTNGCFPSKADVCLSLHPAYALLGRTVFLL